jgi:hypothetical protein
VASKFLLSQTPSIKTTLMKQFAKQEDPQSQRKEAQEREAREQQEGTLDATPVPAASGSDGSAPGDSKSKRVKKGWPWVPWSLRGPEGPAKTDTPNEGMLIVRRPVLHFWLQCHAYVLRWHEEAAARRRLIDAELEAAVGEGGGAAVEGRRSSAGAGPVVVPRPPFLEREHNEEWWARLAESIEVQHGLAVLQSSYAAESARADAEEQKRRYAQWREANAWRGTRRDGSVAEPKAKAKAPAADGPVSSAASPGPARDHSQPANKAMWSVRGRSLVPKKAPKKRKPKLTVL